MKRALRDGGTSNRRGSRKRVSHGSRSSNQAGVNQLFQLTHSNFDDNFRRQRFSCQSAFVLLCPPNPIQVDAKFQNSNSQGTLGKHGRSSNGRVGTNLLAVDTGQTSQLISVVVLLGDVVVHQTLVPLERFSSIGVHILRRILDFDFFQKIGSKVINPSGRDTSDTTDWRDRNGDFDINVSLSDTSSSLSKRKSDNLSKGRGLANEFSQRTVVHSKNVVSFVGSRLKNRHFGRDQRCNTSLVRVDSRSGISHLKKLTLLSEKKILLVHKFS